MDAVQAEKPTASSSISKDLLSRLFRLGHDTKDIAKLLRMTEAQVYNALGKRYER